MSRLRNGYRCFLGLDPKMRLSLLVGFALFIALLLVYTLVCERLKTMERRRAMCETEAGEMLSLKRRYLEATAEAGRSSNLLAAVRPGDTPAGLVEEIGIKGGGVQIKPIRQDDKAGFAEESAEVRIDRLTVNELLNLLYRLEYGERPVTVRRALIKGRFDDPSRVDASLVVALQKSAAQK